MTSSHKTPAFSLNRMKSILSHCQGKKIMCVGDIMLDDFVYGDVTRISPESPIPVLHQKRTTKMLGGAGNAASNLASLGAKVTMVGVIGDDEAGETIKDLSQTILGDNTGLFIDTNRPTIQKTRFLASNQQLLRVDVEDTRAISSDVEDAIIAFVEKNIADFDGVMISDYAKGMITKSLSTRILTLANDAGVTNLVDPKGTDFTKYDGATIVKPNKKELAVVTNMPVSSDEDVEKAGLYVLKNTAIKNIIATRSEDGMSVISRDLPAAHIRTKVKEVYDVSGAGDTVGATILLAMAAGATLSEATYFGNIAGGLVVAKIGTAVLRPDEIEAEMIEQIQGSSTQKYNIPGLRKLATAEEALEKINLWRAQNQRVGFTNGYFDLIHPGHLSLFEQAKQRCDKMIVAINSDTSHAQNKSGESLFQHEMARAAVLSALEYIDMVVIFDEETPLEMIKTLNPDVLIKGNDYPIEHVVGADFVLSQGNDVFLAEIDKSFGTTFSGVKPNIKKTA